MFPFRFSSSSTKGKVLFAFARLTFPFICYDYDFVNFKISLKFTLIYVLNDKTPNACINPWFFKPVVLESRNMFYFSSMCQSFLRLLDFLRIKASIEEKKKKGQIHHFYFCSILIWLTCLQVDVLLLALLQAIRNQLRHTILRDVDEILKKCTGRAVCLQWCKDPNLIFDKCDCVKL